jgi:hypothetical protein
MNRCLHTFHMQKVSCKFIGGQAWYRIVNAGSGPDFLALLTYLLTYSLIELRPSWEAANCAATQELPRVLWNPKVYYRLHKSPPLVPILSQIDPIPPIPSYLSKIHFNIVHPPTSWSSQWSLSFWISHQYPICIPRFFEPALLIL